MVRVGSDRRTDTPPNEMYLYSESKSVFSILSPLFRNGRSGNSTFAISHVGAYSWSPFLMISHVIAFRRV